MAQEDTSPLHQVYQNLRGAEQHKNSLIEVLACRFNNFISNMKQELLHRLDKTNDDFKQEVLDHSREKQFNRDVQLRELQLQEEIRSMKAMMVSSSMNRARLFSVLALGHCKPTEDRLAAVADCTLGA